MTQTLYAGTDKRECLLVLLRWAKLEGYDVSIDPAYAETIGLEIEADYALDWMKANVVDYDYELESGDEFWALTRLTFDRSVVECG